MRKICEAVSRFYDKRGRKRVISSDDYMWRHYILFVGQEFDGGTEKTEHRFNAFLHNIRGSDEPTYHDHPWPYFTIILSGGYWEHTPIIDAEGIVIADSKKWYGPGSFRYAAPSHFHWLELGPTSTWTLFFRFKRVQEWGFLPMWSHVKDKIHWKKWIAQRQSEGYAR